MGDSMLKKRKHKKESEKRVRETVERLKCLLNYEEPFPESVTSIILNRKTFLDGLKETIEDAFNAKVHEQKENSLSIVFETGERFELQVLSRNSKCD